MLSSWEFLDAERDVDVMKVIDYRAPRKPSLAIRPLLQKRACTRTLTHLLQLHPVMDANSELALYCCDKD